MTGVLAALDAAAPAAPRAASDRVDIWRAALDLAPDEAAAAWSVLAGTERAHATRLRHGGGRWAAARAALRRVLGHCLDIAPQHVAFAAGENGRPRLAPGAGADVRFSLSHSGAVALVAVRLGHDVGVDLEELRDDVDREAVAREAFGEREREALARFAGADPREAFFLAWARREAIAKACGLGVVVPAGRLDGARFGVRDLGGIAGFAAAVASAGHGWCLRRRELARPGTRT